MMPTKADFEAAAAKLTAAAQQVGVLTAAAEGAGASDILRGGSLGRQVPAKIAECSATAASCAAALEDVAATCLERAGIIAAYEGEVRIYRLRYDAYRRAYSWWSSEYSRWWVSEGTYPYPGSPPVPPPRPAPPPDWAETERV